MKKGACGSLEDPAKLNTCHKITGTLFCQKKKRLRQPRRPQQGLYPGSVYSLDTEILLSEEYGKINGVHLDTLNWILSVQLFEEDADCHE